jgi:hypothetical protein
VQKIEPSEEKHLFHTWKRRRILSTKTPIYFLFYQIPILYTFTMEWYHFYGAFVKLTYVRECKIGAYLFI